MANKDLAIPVVFPDYLIAVPTPALTMNLPDVIPFFDVLPATVKIPAKTHKVENLGHAGILFIQGTSGLTRYYEYGRYDPAALGLTRKQTVPDVMMGRNGRPTKASLARVLTAVSKQSGQGGRIAGAYIELAPGAFERMDGYAVARQEKNRDAGRAPYELFGNSCLHFMKSTAEAGGARMPGNGTGMTAFTRTSRLPLLLLALTLAAAACTQNSSSEPSRPAGVPADAFWVGGGDGGAFVQLRRDGVGYSGAVYHLDGERWFTGPFRLEPAGATPVDPSDHAAVTGWDGGQLLLTEGRALVSERR